MRACASESMWMRSRPCPTGLTQNQMTRPVPIERVSVQQSDGQESDGQGSDGQGSGLEMRFGRDVIEAGLLFVSFGHSVLTTH